MGSEIEPSREFVAVIPPTKEFAEPRSELTESPRMSPMLRSLRAVWVIALDNPRSSEVA